jgi:RNA polymerase sigma-70 factor (ECF subfamily)
VDDAPQPDLPEGPARPRSSEPAIGSGVIIDDAEPTDGIAREESKEVRVTDDQTQLLQVLYEQHAAALWSHVVRLTGDRAMAEDVVQETLLRAWRHPRVLDQSESSARAWLFTVARNLVIDDWRRARHAVETSTADVPDRADIDDIDLRLQAWQVGDALRRLSIPHREALLECFYRGHSVAEAAVRLGVPPGTVKSRCHYALRQLRLIFEEMGISNG